MQRAEAQVSESVCEVFWLQQQCCLHCRWVLVQSPVLIRTPFRGDSLPGGSVNEWEQYSQMWDMLPAEYRGTYHSVGMGCSSFFYLGWGVLACPTQCTPKSFAYVVGEPWICFLGSFPPHTHTHTLGVHVFTKLSDTHAPCYFGLTLT